MVQVKSRARYRNVENRETSGKPNSRACCRGRRSRYCSHVRRVLSDGSDASHWGVPVGDEDCRSGTKRARTISSDEMIELDPDRKPVIVPFLNFTNLIPFWKEYHAENYQGIYFFLNLLITNLLLNYVFVFLIYSFIFCTLYFLFIWFIYTLFSNEILVNF